MMQIGKVIRRYRKEKNMTQEEMADRLGVTAPAVNKWENGVSMPDIMLLAPIARLLDITPDILLSFREDLTQEEINRFIRELDTGLRKVNKDDGAGKENTDDLFRRKNYEEMFDRAKKMLEQYPGCEELLWQTALMLDVYQPAEETQGMEKFDEYIRNCYIRVLDSRNEKTRTRAADSLFTFYMRRKQYEEAEECLAYMSEQNPETKRHQAEVCSRTGRMGEAYKAYEELLFSGYHMTSMVFQNLYVLAMQEGDKEKAGLLVKKQGTLAEVFEMGRCQEVCSGLEMAVAERDEDAALAIMEELYDNIDSITDFRKSSLYEHMKFKEPREELLEEMKKAIFNSFRDEESYGFLQGNGRYQSLLQKTGQS